MIVSTFAMWLLWAALAFVALWLLVPALDIAIRSRGPGKEPFPKLETWLDELLIHGDDGIHLLLVDPDSDRFIRVRKYIRSEAEDGIALIFPKIGETEDISEKLESYCGEHDIGLSTIDLSDTDRMPCFLVDCGRNRACVTHLARRVWTEFLGLTAKLEYDRTMGFALEDAPVDPAPLRFSRRRRRRFYTVFFVFMFFLITLPIATLASIGEPPGWAAIGASGTAASLGFFVLYLLSFTALVKVSMNTEDSDARMSFEGFFNKGFIVTMVTLPFAVMLFWYGV